MRAISLILAAGLALPAVGAAAQTAYGPTGDKLDDGTCYAQALAAQYAAERRVNGDIPEKQGLTYDEQEYLRHCGGPLPGSPVAVPDTQGPPQGYYYQQSYPAEPQGYYYEQRSYAPYRPYQAGEVQVITNGPVPDTPANRARYRPLSHAGRASVPAGN